MFGIVLGILLLLDVTWISIDHHIILFGVELIISALGSICGLEEEVSLWQLLDIHKKEQPTSQEIVDEEQDKKAS